MIPYVIVAAGGLEAAGHGLRDASTSWEPWGAIGMRAGALIPLARHLAFRSHMDWLVALSRIRLQDTVTGEPFWEVPPLSLAFGAGMLGVFP
ncbi:MAG: hypothetical protein HY744_11215 [Deltaproteobacteria bacterium]|nr:hypothetical protein [Deltaproteobacteria bacterium]